QIGPVVLPHDEKLAAVAEHSRTNPALLEARILLNDGDIPAVEFSQLSVALLNDFLATRDVEEAGDFFIDIPLPNGARERHDVLARVVGDEETGGGLQLLR